LIEVNDKFDPALNVYEGTPNPSSLNSCPETASRRLTAGEIVGRPTSGPMK
jgi:hypothetical protein